MSVTTGLECIVYLGSDYDDDIIAFSDLANWEEVANVVDVNIGRERTEIMVASRVSRFEKNLVGLLKLGFDVKLLRDNADAHQAALAAAYEAGSDVVMIFADGPLETAGTAYVKAQLVVTKFGAGEPLEGAATIDMTVKPSAKSANNPVGGVAV